MKVIIKRSLLVSSALVSAGLWGQAAYAQAKDSPDTASSGLEEIVVTAQKREQSIQDVPVAVTALSPDTLQVNRVQTVMDLNGLAPGLLARVNAGSTGTPSYTMRGIFASSADPAQDRQVATYIDGVYVGGIRGAVFDLPDIQRIEILRGPQGTLFGRNATVGAVSISTREPYGELKVRAEASAGTHDSRRFRLTVDTPQIGIFSAFATYVHDERRGDVRNVGGGIPLDFTSPLHNLIGKTTSPRWLGSKNAESVFAAVKAEPNDSLKVVYKFDWTHNKNTPDARVPLFNGPLLGGVIALQGGDTTYGGYVMPANPQANKRPDTVNNAFSTPGFNKAMGHNVTINYQATDNLSFKSVTSWRTASALGISSVMGVDGLTVTPGVIAFLPTFPIPVPGLGTVNLPFYTPARAGQLIEGYTGVNYGKYRQFSSELQANYNSQLVTVTAGALYYKSRELSSGLPGSPTNFGLLIALGGIPQAIGAFLTPGGNFAGTVFSQNLSYNTNAPYLLGNVQEKRQTTKSMAAYAQAEIHITPELDVVIGGRVTRDEKSQTFVQGGTYSAAANAIVGTSSITTPFKKTKPTYSVGVNYKVTPDTLVYGKFSTAYLSGGASGPLTFLPETVKSWEAGLKAEFLDRRVRLNLAVYNAKYQNTQSAQGGSNVTSPACGTTGLPVSCSAYGVVVISNGPVRARGFEAELTVAPAEGLTFGGSLAYTDTKWLNPSVLITGGRPVLPSGIPKWMGGVNGQYVSPELSDGSTVLVRLDANYQGKYRGSPFTDVATNTTGGQTTPGQLPYVFTRARWLLNGRIALRDVDMGPVKAEVGLWGRNLTNNKDAVYSLIFGALNVNASYQQARTLGMDVIVNF